MKLSALDVVKAKAFTLASAGLVGMTALVACGGGGGGGNNQTLASDQTLKFPIYSDFGTLDPGLADAESDTEISQNIFDNVVIFNKDLKVVPDLAASMPDVSSDGLTYTFKLRQDVTFSNGDKFTSADVLYSWNRAAALQGPYSTNLTPIVGYSTVSANTKTGADLETLLEKKDPSVTMSGLTAPDPYTVVAKLSTPAGWWLSAIALEGATGAIVDVNAVKQDPANWWTKPETLIGTGPFKMVNRTPNQSVDFDAVPNWWGSPKPTLKHVHLDILQNPSSGVTAWEQKKYDVDGYGGYSNIPVADILRIKNSSSENSQLLLHPKVRTTWVGFNFSNAGGRTAGGPFIGDAGKNLRLAFIYSVDRQKLASVVCHNLVCQPATGGLITKGLTGYGGDNTDPLAKFDASKAKSLLQQGDPDGSKTKDLTYTYDVGNPLNASVAQFLQDQWQTNLGVHVNLQGVNHSQFIKAYCKGSYPLHREGWQADYNHPQDWFDNLWGALATSGGCNADGFDSPEYDSLLKQADSQPLDQALSTYKQLSKILQDNAVYLPLYYSTGAFLIHDYVGGAGTNNFFDNYWNTIKIYQH